MMKTLIDHHIDLEYFRAPLPLRRRLRTAPGNVVNRHKLPEFPSGHMPALSSQCYLPTKGQIYRTPTIRKKVVTIVCYIRGKDEWNSEWSGGLEVCWPHDTSKAYNFMNQKMPFAGVRALQKYGYEANLAILFITLPNSWHSVHPMTGIGESTLRRTVTIVVERN